MRQLIVGMSVCLDKIYQKENKHFAKMFSYCFSLWISGILYSVLGLTCPLGTVVSFNQRR